MGYYTNYLITYTPNEDLERAFKDGGLDDFGLFSYDLYKYKGGWGLHGKWYDHDDDLLRLSVLYPDVLFTLEGWGEEDGDIWRAFYKNGKSKTQEARIVYDEFDPKELE